MRVRIVRIGNSKGLRIPKPLLREAGLGDEVEMNVRGKSLLIKPARGVRSGWAEAFRAMAERGDDALLDAESQVGSQWDEREWRW